MPPFSATITHTASEGHLAVQCASCWRCWGNTGLPGITASEQRVTRLQSTSLLHWLPHRACDQHKQQTQDDKSAKQQKQKQKQGTPLSLSSVRNPVVNKWHPAPLPNFWEKGDWFAILARHCAKRLHSLEHATLSQAGGARFVIRTAAAQIRHCVLANSPHSWYLNRSH